MEEEEEEAVSNSNNNNDDDNDGGFAVGRSFVVIVVPDFLIQIYMKESPLPSPPPPYCSRWEEY